MRGIVFMAKIVIFGTGSIAEVAHFYFTNDTEHQIVSFTNAQDFIKEPSFLKLPLIPFEELEKHYSPDDYLLFIAIGYRDRNKIRAQRYLEAKQKGYRLVTYISSKASYYGTPVGENCFIFENNVIQPFVSIGNNVILWSGNHIGHHSIIMDHCFISSHVVVSGSCTIRENCFLGVNATLRDNITIGSHTIVGAGALVMEDCADYCLIVPDRSKQRVVKRKSS
jgi:sugar O-acyltransferase (sialic acid O-acetyltransferase NeuD family)